MTINIYDYHKQTIKEIEELLFEYHNLDTGLEFNDIVEKVIFEEGINRQEALELVGELEEINEYY